MQLEKLKILLIGPSEYLEGRMDSAFIDLMQDDSAFRDLSYEYQKLLDFIPNSSLHGKSSIANLLSESIKIEEAGTPRPTQGVRIVEFELKLNINDKQCTVDIELWDCSGDHKFESCWPALRVGVQGVILVCSANTVNVAAREMELLYNYFVSQAKLTPKQCVVFYNTEDPDDIDIINLSSTFSKVSQVAVNVKSGGTRLKIDFSNFVSSILQTLNKSNNLNQP